MQFDAEFVILQRYTLKHKSQQKGQTSKNRRGFKKIITLRNTIKFSLRTGAKALAI